MSSTMARVSRNTFRRGGTRLPNTATSARAKAMSVAMGMPHPSTPTPPAFTARKMTAGTIIPPSAAMPGRTAADFSRSSPATSSRLISRPTTKKKMAIRPSFTQWVRSSRTEKLPMVTAISVCQKSTYDWSHGELAHTRAMTVAARRKTPPAASTSRNDASGRPSVRARGRSDSSQVARNGLDLVDTSAPGQGGTTADQASRRSRRPR